MGAENQTGCQSTPHHLPEHHQPLERVRAALAHDEGDVAGRDLHRRQGPERVAEDVAEVRGVGAPREMLRDALAVDLVHNIGLRGSAPLADDRLVRPAVAPALLRRLRPRAAHGRRPGVARWPERFAGEQERYQDPSVARAAHRCERNKGAEVVRRS